MIYAGAAGDFFGLPYDYRSLMHYRKGSHSTDPDNKITIQTLDPNMQEVILTSFVTPPLNKVQKPEQSATYVNQPE